jgi:dCMP deaminase
MNESWRTHFLELAILISTRSKDPSTKVGALIVDSERRMLGSGYNGFPRFVNDDPSRYADRETKLRMVVHAEVNAILNATKSVVGSTLISTRAPCTGCTGVIIQSGISEVICPDQAANSRWADDWEIAKGMLEEAGVVKTYVTLPEITYETQNTLIEQLCDALDKYGDYDRHHDKIRALLEETDKHRYNVAQRKRLS